MGNDIITLQDVGKAGNVTTCVIVERKPQLEVDYLLLNNKRIVRCERTQIDFTEYIHVNDENGNFIGKYRRTKTSQRTKVSEEVAIWNIVE